MYYHLHQLLGTLTQKYHPLSARCELSPSHLFQTQPRSQDHGLAPSGFYFFYGALQDSGLLMDMLDLQEISPLRPACVEGYKCKLWGD